MGDEIERRIGGTALFFPADLGGMQTPRLWFYNFKNREKLGKKVARRAVDSSI